MRAFQTVCVALMVAAAVPAAAQSLGEVSRQEEARRAATKKATISLSNADLKPSEIAPPSGAPAVAAEESCYKSIALGRCATPDEVAKQSQAIVDKPENDSRESAWRNSADLIRGPLMKLLQEVAEVTPTTTDESRAPWERAAASKILAQHQSAIAELERRWKMLEKNAAGVGVSHAWLEPVPPFPPK